MGAARGAFGQVHNGHNALIVTVTSMHCQTRARAITQPCSGSPQTSVTHAFSFSKGFTVNCHFLHDKPFIKGRPVALPVTEARGAAGHAHATEAIVPPAAWCSDCHFSPVREVLTFAP